jgi:hypothetical protein
MAMFATLSEGKGQEEALRAVARVVAEGGNIELLLAGYVDPPYQARLEATISELGLEDHVRVLGFLEDPFPAMWETEIVLVCSRREAFGRVAVEALLMGKAVVYAAAGGTLEYMVDGQTGLAYPAGDSAALAERISRLVREPALRERLGAEGQAFARGRFTREGYGGEVYRTMRELRGKRARPARMPRLLQPMVGQVLVELVRQGLPWYMLSVVLFGVQGTASHYFLAAHQPRKAGLLLLGRQLLAIPLFLVLPPLLGFQGLYLVVGLADLPMAILAAVLLRQEWRLLAAPAEAPAPGSMAESA